MPIKKIIEGKFPVLAWTDEIEETAIQQLKNISEMPIIHHHVAAMPDCHWGKGATVGSVIPCKSAIIPSAVGVDLGCGMMACMLNLKAQELPDNLNLIRSGIEAVVPHGRTDNGGRNDRGAWGEIPERIASKWKYFNLHNLDHLAERHANLFKGHINAERHLGTLGTGNHFIEICLDEQQNVWIMLHSGSRGIGNKIGSYFIELAKEDMQQAVGNLPDSDLAYLTEGTQHFNDYVDAVHWAQEFALYNREIMMLNTITALRKALNNNNLRILTEAINCHHNYVEKEEHYGEQVWVTRKGAICARKDQLGIIPGSMGAKSFIVKGKGNQESFHSCSHGAGRKMSRGQAKKLFTQEDLVKQTLGVECRKDTDVIDEIPGAYKDIEQVMLNQSDLVEVVHTLKQVVCVKG
jgi:tRNA-splicing ligase RtcB